MNYKALQDLPHSSSAIKPLWGLISDLASLAHSLPAAEASSLLFQLSSKLWYQTYPCFSLFLECSPPSINMVRPLISFKSLLNGPLPRMPNLTPLSKIVLQVLFISLFCLIFLLKIYFCLTYYIFIVCLFLLAPIRM